jgi:hypothetical protein
MKYFLIKTKRYYENNMIATNANGEFVPEADAYFYRMSNGEIFLNAPIFDYFHLQSFDKKEFWEWILCDVYNGIGKYPNQSNWYISDRLKALFEKFIIAQDYHFYETRLLYKGEKLKYWIFQFLATYRKLNKTKYISFTDSIFFSKNTSKKIMDVNSYNDYLTIEKELSNNNDELKTNYIVLNDYIDFTTLIPLRPDIIISERLKNAIEENGITGFEFSELDYEVIVNE